MRTKSTKGLILILFLGICFSGVSQTFKTDAKTSKIEIDGTSNIHDWTINAERFQANLSVQKEDSKILNIQSLELKLVAASLKSGKSGMDKNTYKALNTDKYPNITFQLSEKAAIKTNTTAVLKGVLKISGKTQHVTIPVKVEEKDDKIHLTGNHEIDMTAYGIEPPTAMFGTISTGEKVTVKFNLQFQ